MGLRQFNLKFLQVTEFTEFLLFSEQLLSVFLSLKTIVRVSEMCGSAPDDPCASTSR
jgi:hypothetical protein